MREQLKNRSSFADKEAEMGYEPIKVEGVNPTVRWLVRWGIAIILMWIAVSIFAGLIWFIVRH